MASGQRGQFQVSHLTHRQDFRSVAGSYSAVGVEGHQAAAAVCQNLRSCVWNGTRSRPSYHSNSAVGADEQCVHWPCCPFLRRTGLPVRDAPRPKIASKVPRYRPAKTRASRGPDASDSFTSGQRSDTTRGSVVGGRQRCTCPGWWSLLSRSKSGADRDWFNKSRRVRVEITERDKSSRFGSVNAVQSPR